MSCDRSCPLLITRLTRTSSFKGGTSMPFTGISKHEDGAAMKRRRYMRKAICLLAGPAVAAMIPMSTRAEDRQGKDDEETFTCTVQVVAPHSIQDAIEGAPTGATVCVGPGTYQENLLINKDGITLKGAGPEKTVLEPPAQPRPFCPVLEIPPIGYEPLGVNGICIADLDAEGEVQRTVNGVRVTGFTVRDFSGVGIMFGGTNRSRADHNVAASNQGYGITAFLSTHVHL